jgi:hypothetical protein
VAKAENYAEDNRGGPEAEGTCGEEGFAFVAYPAEYRSSGVMTFIVGSERVVYQRDLGKATDAISSSMQIYNPDSAWKKAEESSDTTAREPRSR